MSFLRRLLNVGRDERLARDIDREIAFHLRERVEELRAGGYSESDAVAIARRQFGNRTYQAEETRSADVVTWMDSVRADVRYALRALRRSPAFTAVAVASLALGIGANTAIYTLLDAVMLRALPVSNPHELVQITTGDDDAAGYFTNPLWEQVRDHASGFAALAAFAETNFNIADGGEVRHIRGSWVSGDYFRMFGVQPALGRLLTPQDDVRGCSATAVLSHGFWQTEYGARPDVVGGTISLSGMPATIVGVAASGFHGPEVGRSPQVFVPICAEAITRGANSILDGRSNWWMRAIARLAPGVSLEEATTRIKAISAAAYGATVPPRWSADAQQGYRERTFALRPAANGLSGLRVQYSKSLMIMMGAVALVLLIASANVANLMLARAAAREREIAVRLAVGAGRMRLVRQLVTESILLAVLGAALGLVIARWGTVGLVALISSDTSPITLDLDFSWRVLGFTAGVAAITAVLFGLTPAWRGTRVSPQVAMKANARGLAEGHARFTLGKSLVVAQLALSLTLLVGAGLLVGTLRNLSTLDPGFRAEGVLIADADFRRTGMPGDQVPDAAARALARIRALPGVTGAATTSMTPLAGNSWNDELIVEGHVSTSFTDRLAWFNEVGDGYFTTMGMRLVAGRDFGPEDVATGPKVAIVNESMARRFFGGASPLGRTYRLKAGDDLTDPVTIVGVVSDSKYLSLREDNSGTVFLPESQRTGGVGTVTMVVRSSGDPMQLIGPLKSVFAEVQPSIALTFRGLEAQLAASLRRERMLATLSALFGGVALALSMLGLYGVMAYNVARRRNELGVRIALGADNGRVLRLVLGDVARVIAIGIVVGAAGALASGKLVRSFLFGLEPAEPLVLLGAVVVLTGVALLSGFIPAWRASRLDPVQALREE